MGRLANLLRASASLLRAAFGWTKGDGSVANDVNEIADKIDPPKDGDNG